MTPIPLDRQQNPYNLASPMPDSVPRPTVVIHGPEALEFPEYCLVTFRVCRGEIVARSGTRGQPASASVELKLKEVTNIEECEADEEQEGAESEESPIDRLFEASENEKSENE